jgi:hypothetical protein
MPGRRSLYDSRSQRKSNLLGREHRHARPRFAMSEPKKNSAWGLREVFALTCFILLFGLLAIPSFGGGHRTSPANACVNNLRQIDGAKQQWALEHNAKSNDIITIKDIRTYIESERNNSYIKLDTKGNLPKCPSGGIYTIGKIGENPTCSVGNTVTPGHILP